MNKRLLGLSGCFLAMTVYLHAGRPAERVPAHQPLTDLPWQIGAWTGKAAPKISDDVLSVLGVDEYVNRYYARAGDSAVGLYVGYYWSQRQDDTIHSPMNCLPGAGWQPVSAERIAIDLPAAAEPIRVNQVLIEKGLDRQLVLYWYQSQGRVIASEYWSKVFLVWDSIRTHRSDAALVRVVTAIGASDSGITDARDRLTAFVQAIFPSLGEYLPS